ncbi:hypothetical protein Hanom_Chr04g00373411 [Helianthus anomalus]
MAALLNTSCEDLTTKHKCTDPKKLPQQIDSMIGEGRMMHVSIKKEGHVAVTNVTEVPLQNRAAPQRRCVKSVEPLFGWLQPRNTVQPKAWHKLEHLSPLSSRNVQQGNMFCATYLPNSACC